MLALPKLKTKNIVIYLEGQLKIEREKMKWRAALLTKERGQNAIGKPQKTRAEILTAAGLIKLVVKGLNFPS